MTEFVGKKLNFGDLILREPFDYGGKSWQSYRLIPQEHLEDLFHSPHAIKPIDAYNRAPQFWKRISELTRDFYKDYLATQTMPANGAIRRDFNAGSNQPIRLSIFARDPAV